MPRHAAPRQFSTTDVLVIRAAAHVKMPVRRLAEHYGVSRQTIDKIVKRETYRRGDGGEELHALMLPVLDFRTPVEGVACSSPTRGEYTKAAERMASMVFNWSRRSAKSGICAQLGHHPSKGVPRTDEVKAKISAGQRRAILRHLQGKWGDQYDEALAMAMTGLGPRLPFEEYRARRSAVDPAYRQAVEIKQSSTKTAPEDEIALREKIAAKWGVSDAPS